jgi:alpha-methylacyl-CoA racemase
VLTLEEATRHRHNQGRGTFVEVDGIMQPAAAPRFSRTPASSPGPVPASGAHTAEVLLDWGFDQAEVAALLAAGAVAG